MDEILNSEIIFVTSMIQENYPDLYRNLTETPLFGGGGLHENIDTNEFENYLETLTTQYIDVRITRDKERPLV